MFLILDCFPIVQPKAGQKRPATSPAPILPPQSSHHHLQSSQLPNHIANHLGQQTGVGSAPSAGNVAGGSSGRGPFASALRNLAKQADIKEDDLTVGSGAANVAGGSTGGSSSAMQPRPSSAVESRSNDGRPSSGLTPDVRNIADERNASKKKTISPQPPTEKVCL